MQSKNYFRETYDFLQLRVEAMEKHIQKLEAELAACEAREVQQMIDERCSNDMVS